MVEVLYTLPIITRKLCARLTCRGVISIIAAVVQTWHCCCMICPLKPNLENVPLCFFGIAISEMNYFLAVLYVDIVKICFFFVRYNDSVLSLLLTPFEWIVPKISVFVKSTARMLLVFVSSVVCSGVWDQW